VFEEILGLPAHPLIVHAAVVLVPLLALGGVLYAVAPFSRRYFRWPLILVALAAPAAVAAAKLSGDAFSKHQNFNDMQAQITDHKAFGDVLIWLALGLGAAVLVLAFAVPGRRDVVAARDADDTLVDSSSRSGGMVVIQVVVGIVVVGLAAANLYYVFKAGDSGANMVWSGY
jgi:hypothetical protein